MASTRTLRDIFVVAAALYCTAHTVITHTGGDDPRIEAPVVQHTSAQVSQVPDIPPETRTVPDAMPQRAEAASETQTIVDIVAAARPAVVRIESEMSTVENSVGSGVIFRTDPDAGTALVLTSYHVVDDTLNPKIIVHDTTPYTGTVIGADEQRDVAVIEICCNASFVPLRFNTDAMPMTGSNVVAIGYPLGLEGAPTVTAGIVAAQRFNRDRATFELQTDAAVNPGNSGGPLLAVDGRVVGIITRVLADSSTDTPVGGFAFAIAAPILKWVVQDIAGQSLGDSQQAPAGR